MQLQKPPSLRPGGLFWNVYDMDACKGLFLGYSGTSLSVVEACGRKY